MDFAFEPLAAGDNIFYFFTVTGIFYFDLFLAFVQLYFLGEKKKKFSIAGVLVRVVTGNRGHI